jgi:hypothetical protein
MEKKQRKQKRDYDFAVNAFRVVQEATGQTSEPEQPKPLSTYSKNLNSISRIGPVDDKKSGFDLVIVSFLSP